MTDRLGTRAGQEIISDKRIFQGEVVTEGVLTTRGAVVHQGTLTAQGAVVHTNSVTHKAATTCEGAVTCKETVTCEKAITGTSATLSGSLTANTCMFYPMVVNNNLENDGVADATMSGASGIIIAYVVSKGYVGIYTLEGSTLTKIAANAKLETIKDNATTINLYVETGVLKVQNKLGEAINVRVLYIA